jgi:hypothetical protein
MLAKETEAYKFCTFLQCVDTMTLGFTEPYESGLTVRDSNGVEIMIPLEYDELFCQERLMKAAPEGSRVVGFYATGRGLLPDEHGGVYVGLKECKSIYPARD